MRRNHLGEIHFRRQRVTKAVTVTWKLQAMVIADFIPFLQRELGQRIFMLKRMRLFAVLVDN